MARSGVIAGGNWLVDRVKMLDAFPAQDHLCRVQGVHLANGGYAYNVLKDLRLMGAKFPLYAAGLLGDDSEADFILRDCASLGIDTRMLVKTRGARTSSTDVMTDSRTGRRTFFYDAAACADFDFSDFDISCNSAKILLCGYIGLLDKMDSRLSYGGFFARAKSMGFETAADFASVRGGLLKISRGAFASLDYISLNETEAAKIGLYKGAADSFESMKAAAGKMFSLGLGKAALIHHRAGSYVFLRDGAHIWRGAVKVPESRINGANGCGDAMNAGFLYALHENKSFEEALLWGTASAAACLANPTASGGIKKISRAVAEALKLGFEAERK